MQPIYLLMVVIFGRGFLSDVENLRRLESGFIVLLSCLDLKLAYLAIFLAIDTNYVSRTFQHFLC